MKKSVFYMKREVCGTVMPICACDNSVKVCANCATPQFKLCNIIVLTDPVTPC